MSHQNPYQDIVMSESFIMNIQEDLSDSVADPNPELNLPDPNEEASRLQDIQDDDKVNQSMEEPSSSKERKDFHSPQFEAFLKEFQNQNLLEGKLQLAIDFMEASLSQSGTPSFRNFWEARRLCLPLFKENISPTVRSQLWHKYSELSKEARRLKDLLDEQSAFAVEQIEIAIQGLEKDIEQFEAQLEHVEPFPDLSVFPSSLAGHFELYSSLQRQLNLLNAQTARINALRKELLKTDMRVRLKNKFFQRLSAAGDKVFPRRKELIKQVSQQFVQDVEEFIKAHFGNELSHDSLYQLREEIKTLQGLAKALTLNTNSFTQTRLQLSECWDKLKGEEKERKKERAQQRAVFKQSVDLVQQQIQSFKEEFGKGHMSVGEAHKKLDEIVSLMRQQQLGRDEVKFLRDEISAARRPVQERAKADEEARHQQEQEQSRLRREKYKNLRDQADGLVKKHENYSGEQLTEERDRILSEVNESSFSRTEKQEIERVLKPLRDIITEKKEKAILALSEDDRQALQQLKEILRQRKERRQEIKNQLETLRKGANSSSLDFEKAIQYATQIEEENERLEKANQGIKEVEQKIAQLQAKIKG